MAWTAPRTWLPSAVLNAEQLNTDIRDNSLFLKECTALGAAEEVQIAGDAATITHSYVELGAETSPGVDDLDTISTNRAGLGQGTIVVLRAKTGDTITLKDETALAGNLEIGDDIVLENGKHVMLILGPLLDWHLLYSPTDVTFTVNAFQYPAPGTDWTPQVEGAHLGVSKTDDKVWLPLNFLKVGDEIISYTLNGVTVVTGTTTLDCKLVRIEYPVNAVDVTSGGITQITANGDFSSTVNLPTAETVVLGRQYTLEIEGTTDTSDTITVMGARVVVRRLI